MAMVARVWSISALAVELGRDRRTIAGLLESVRPAEMVKGSPRYKLADVVAALYGRPAADAGAPPGRASTAQDLTSASARLKTAQADKTELEVEVLRGTLIPADVVARTWANFVTAVRSRFIALPSTAAPRVCGLTVREAESELRALVNAGLAELAEYDAAEYGNTAAGAVDSTGGTDDRAASGRDRIAVGGREPRSKPRGVKRTGKVVD